MPQTRTQTCTDQHNKHRFIALSESSKRMPKAAAARRQPMIESARAACGASAVDCCEICKAHGPGEASNLLRGGLGGLGLGLDVLEDCAPSAALLLLVGHVFSTLKRSSRLEEPTCRRPNIICWAGGKGGCRFNG